MKTPVERQQFKRFRPKKLIQRWCKFFSVRSPSLETIQEVMEIATFPFLVLSLDLESSASLKMADCRIKINTIQSVSICRIHRYSVCETCWIVSRPMTITKTHHFASDSTLNQSELQNHF